MSIVVHCLMSFCWLAPPGDHSVVESEHDGGLFSGDHKDLGLKMSCPFVDEN